MTHARTAPYRHPFRGLPEVLRGAFLSRWFVPCCMLLATALRAAWIACVPTQQISDAAVYFRHASELARGLGYQVAGHPTAYYPVGYPAFLALLFTVFPATPLVGACANVALSVGTIGLMYALARRFHLGETASRLLVLLMAVHPGGIAFCGLLMTETLTTFLLTAAVLVHLRASGTPGWRATAAAGVLYGLSVLVRPQIIVLPLLLEAVLLYRSGWRRPGLRALATLYVPLLLVTLPWIARNNLAFGSPAFLSTNGGMILYMGNNPSATGGYHYPAGASGMSAGINERVIDERLRSAAWDYMRTHPLETVALWPAKFYRTYKTDAGAITWTMQGVDEGDTGVHIFLGVMRKASKLYYFAVCLCAAGYLVLRRRVWRADLPSWIGVAVVVYFTTICLVFHGADRYRFPAMPWIFFQQIPAA
jgi:4-amino-4-deoxy-L-arabinose transferase-like glycosyltransferase